MQERLESTAAGRVVATAIFALLVLAMVLWSAPDSTLKTELLPIVRPVVGATGIEQSWGVFSPNPRQIVLAMEATITFEDGSTARWTVPDGREPVLSPYRYYRWRKWMELTRADRNRGRLWEPAAQWVARIHTTAERTVTRVELTRRWYDIPAPGTRGTEPPTWSSYVFYTYDVPAGEVP